MLFNNLLFHNWIFPKCANILIFRYIGLIILPFKTWNDKKGNRNAWMIHVSLVISCDIYYLACVYISVCACVSQCICLVFKCIWSCLREGDCLWEIPTILSWKLTIWLPSWLSWSLAISKRHRTPVKMTIGENLLLSGIYKKTELDIYEWLSSGHLYSI